MTMKTASGIGCPTPKSIIALLNYREFSFTKIEISIATAFYRAR